MGRGQWDKAVTVLEKVLAEEPNDVRTMLKLGDVFAKKGDRDRAIDVYERVAEHHADQGFFLKAVAVYKQILKLDGHNGTAALRIAELHEQLGLAQDAMVHFQLALPILEEQGHTDHALGVLKRILELDPENVAARIKLAESLSRLEDRTGAVKHFAEAAQVLKQQARIEDYVKVAERLIFHDPYRLDVVKDLAKLYLSRGDTKRGLAKLQICFRETPRDVETLTLLARAFSNLDQVQKTVYVYRELARVHEDEGRQAEAREIHRLILQHHPDDPEALRALGMVDAPLPVSNASDGSDVDFHLEEPVDAFSFPSTPSGNEQPTGALPINASRDLRSNPSNENEEAVESGFALRRVQATNEFHVLAPSPTPRPHPEAVADAYADSGDLVVDVEPPVESLPPTSNPNDIHRIIREAEVYIRYNLPAKALEHLEFAYKSDPTNALVYRRLYDAFLSMNDRPRAAAAVAKAMLLLEEQNEVAAAQDARETLLQLDPSHPALQGIDTTPYGALFSLEEPIPHAVEEPLGSSVEDIPVETGEFGLPFDAPPQWTNNAQVSVPWASTSEVDYEAAAALGAPAGSRDLDDFDHIEPISDAFEVEPDQFEAAELEQEILPPPHPSFSPLVDQSELLIDSSLVVEPFEESPGSSLNNHPLASAAMLDPAPASSTFLEVVPPPEESASESIDLADAVAALERNASNSQNTEDTLEDELAEIGFFLDAELFDDAREALKELGKAYPNHPRVAEYQSLLGTDGLTPDESAEATVQGVSIVENELAPVNVGAEVVNGHAPELDDDEASNAIEPELSWAVDSMSVPLHYDYGQSTLGDSDEPLEPAHEFNGLTPLPEEDEQDVLSFLGVPQIASSELEDEPNDFPITPTRSIADEHYDQGMAYKQIGQLEEAADAFRSAAEASPDRAADALEMLGHCLTESQRLPEAITAFQRALSHCRDDAASTNLHYELGDVHERMGDFDSARFWFESCYALQSNHRDIERRLKDLPSEPLATDSAAELPRKRSKISYI